ncbi:hypothetical protein GPS47_01765 [Acinetobacter haemolyticus]|nr:hypothetical protein [Acinetobacter haemolyticus]NAS04352.1 hypothetical protein [Acinetobacter haemolyticus]QHI30436.1 hypothetical protein AhaeINNSZ174_13705 [Acinetobacter haemolyticus]QHI31762.1 hypothetical protein Ahae11616_03250 [Acinetobacter haemolyticus]RSC82253.1 hypothetical protein EGT42_13270 [Acinetobacter haemolyticus]
MREQLELPFYNYINYQKRTKNDLMRFCAVLYCLNNKMNLNIRKRGVYGRVV